ncbi:MAG: hypothetical protein F4Y45_06015 [Acidobacteria bacterium]|nr:hypothetical protein [Acidobacteriota bacterium]MYJ03428.1 hypothetical protein [Acidobacteriota bacterium]
MRRATALVILVAVSSGLWAQEGAPARPAAPLEPMAALLDAFESYDVVALSDPHGNQQVHAFHLSLIRDPRLARAVDDIVFETGNALYQEVVDRYVNGADVPIDELRLVWQNTTQRRVGEPPVERPLVAAFFRNVREVNLSRSPGQRLRILLGDPPINWAEIETQSDVQPWLYLRDTHPAELIQREVLDKGRRAFVIYGGMHLQRQNLFSNYELVDDRRVHTLVQQLEGAGTPVFTVWVNASTDLEALQADISTWPAPSLAHVRGTLLGAADFETFYPFDVPRARLVEGALVPIAREEWRTLPMEEQFDAVLHLGSPAR